MVHSTTPSSRTHIAAAICREARKTLATGVAFHPFFHIPFPLVLLAFLALKAFLADRFAQSARKQDGPELACYLVLTSVAIHLVFGSLIVAFPKSEDWWDAIAATATPWLLCAAGMAMLATAAWRGRRGSVEDQEGLRAFDEQG